MRFTLSEPDTATTIGHSQNEGSILAQSFRLLSLVPTWSLFEWHMMNPSASIWELWFQELPSIDSFQETTISNYESVKWIHFIDWISDS